MRNVQLEMSPKVVAVCFQPFFVCGSHEISLMASQHRVSTNALTVLV